tara:strand:+ start:116 stop:331 length:216 start_codon:yes stop_codon:yes gene_type:complete
MEAQIGHIFDYFYLFLACILAKLFKLAAGINFCQCEFQGGQKLTKRVDFGRKVVALSICGGKIIKILVVRA